MSSAASRPREKSIGVVTGLHDPIRTAVHRDDGAARRRAGHYVPMSERRGVPHGITTFTVVRIVAS